jgi:hypothetical protein
VGFFNNLQKRFLGFLRLFIIRPEVYWHSSWKYYIRTQLTQDILVGRFRLEAGILTGFFFFYNPVGFLFLVSGFLFLYQSSLTISICVEGITA